ncbi:MAG: hypothetical protein ABI690_18815 [Chloroflexota bacterium]
MSENKLAPPQQPQQIKGSGGGTIPATANAATAAMKSILSNGFGL